MDWGLVDIVVGNWEGLVDFSGLNADEGLGEIEIIERSGVVVRFGGRVMISFADGIADISAQRKVGQFERVAILAVLLRRGNFFDIGDFFLLLDIGSLLLDKLSFLLDFVGS